MNPIYHYTSYDVLNKIVKDKCMWATHIAHLNDSTEYMYTLNLLSEIRNPYTENHVKGLKRSLPRNFEATLDFLSAEQFVICFSRAEDLLSQWRAYCPHSGGVAIGFDKKGLEIFAAESKAHFVQCEYDFDKQKEELAKLVRRNLPEGDLISEFTKLATRYSLQTSQISGRERVADCAPARARLRRTGRVSACPRTLGAVLLDGNVQR